MKHVDVCIIGGGPSGYAAAMRAVDYNKKVLIVEKNMIGGAGLRNGALSSKCYWELSKDIMQANRISSKYAGNKLNINLSDIHNDVKETIAYRSGVLTTNIEKLQTTHPDLFQAKGVATIIDKHTVEIKYNDSSVEQVKTDYIIIATGSRPRKVPNIPVDEKIIFTSDGIESMESFPKSMVIIGAGVIGCEWATIFANFGQTKVNIIDKEEHILPFEDDDIIEHIEGNMTRMGINIHRRSTLSKIRIVDDHVEYELERHDGTTSVHHVEKALLAIGRVSNTEGLGLENIGIQMKDNGGIWSYDTQTSVDNIFAVGDVTQNMSLVNVGEMEARHAIAKMFANSTSKLHYRNISAIMFLNPETAGVGMNERQARKRKLPYRVVSLDYSMIPRANAMKNHNGIFKILVTDDDEMRILGMRAIGVHASSAIQAVALLINMNKGIDELADVLHPHPSIIEGIQECLRMLKGKSIMKPDVFKDVLRCHRCDEQGNVSEWRYKY